MEPLARQSEQAMYAFVSPDTREPIANYVVNIHIYVHETCCLLDNQNSIKPF